MPQRSKPASSVTRKTQRCGAGSSVARRSESDAGVRVGREPHAGGGRLRLGQQVRELLERELQLGRDHEGVVPGERHGVHPAALAATALAAADVAPRHSGLELAVDVEQVAAEVLQVGGDRPPAGGRRRGSSGPARGGSGRARRPRRRPALAPARRRARPRPVATRAHAVVAHAQHAALEHRREAATAVRPQLTERAARGAADLEQEHAAPPARGGSAPAGTARAPRPGGSRRGRRARTAPRSRTPTAAPAARVAIRHTSIPVG